MSLAVNLPGPLVARRLHAEGATVTKVEPVAGDPLATLVPSLYQAVTTGQQVVHLALKDPADRARLDPLLDRADLLLTSFRPAALQRLGLSWPAVSAGRRRLSQVAMVGEVGHRAGRPGHDLTYQAMAGTLGVELPRVLLADQVAAERAVAEALLALRLRERTGTGSYREVGLVDVTRDLAEPLRHGLTAPGGPLGGGLPAYRVYPARTGRVAVAALEPHFRARLLAELGVDDSVAALATAFLKRDAPEWEDWGRRHDLPLTAVATPGSAVPH